jgi:hypothetical protein
MFLKHDMLSCHASKTRYALKHDNFIVTFKNNDI